jgi:hypothetical protein
MTSQTHPPEHWTCLQCEERIANKYMVCWSCGASREGVPDPKFRHADAAPHESQEDGDVARPGEMTGLRTAGGVVFLILGTLVFLSDAVSTRSQWSAIVLWLALWAVAALLWPWK